MAAFSLLQASSVVGRLAMMVAVWRIRVGNFCLKYRSGPVGHPFEAGAGLKLLGSFCVSGSSDAVTSGNPGLAAIVGSLKLSSRDSPPTLAKSDWTTLWTSCLLSAPWNWSSALDTRMWRPLTPPCEFT